jgi:hypothetical protein
MGLYYVAIFSTRVTWQYQFKCYNCQWKDVSPECSFNTILTWILLNKIQGCGYVFQDTRNFHSPSQKTTGPIHRNCQWEGKNPSPGWRVGLYFNSPIPNSTRIWRVGEWLSAPLQDLTLAFVPSWDRNCIKSHTALCIDQTLLSND